MKELEDEEREEGVLDKGKSFQGSPEARESPVNLTPERIPDCWLEDLERVSSERCGQQVEGLVLRGWTVF